MYELNFLFFWWIHTFLGFVHLHTSRFAKQRRTCSILQKNAEEEYGKKRENSQENRNTFGSWSSKVANEPSCTNESSSASPRVGWSKKQDCQCPARGKNHDSR